MKTNSRKNYQHSATTQEYRTRHDKGKHHRYIPWIGVDSCTWKVSRRPITSKKWHFFFKRLKATVWQLRFQTLNDLQRALGFDMIFYSAEKPYKEDCNGERTYAASRETKRCLKCTQRGLLTTQCQVGPLEQKINKFQSHGTSDRSNFSGKRNHFPGGA
jgi:hypothetical protein